MRAYRPANWPLPLSRRPRHSLEFFADHRVVSLTPGGADARVTHAGTWERSNTGRIRARWTAGGAETEVEVLDWTEELMRLTELVGSIE